MVKNSIRVVSFQVIVAGGGAFCRAGGQKKAGTVASRLRRPLSRQPAGRFIWQLVGVLETYGSICLIGTKV